MQAGTRRLALTREAREAQRGAQPAEAQRLRASLGFARSRGSAPAYTHSPSRNSRVSQAQKIGAATSPAIPNADSSSSIEASIA